MIGQYAYLIAAVGLGVAVLVLVYLVQLRRGTTSDTKHSWMSYLLVWPLILDADRGKREGRFLTKREWIGWAIVGLIVIGAIIFTR
jgi:hypothetical protein